MRDYYKKTKDTEERSPKKAGSKKLANEVLLSGKFFKRQIITMSTGNGYNIQELRCHSKIKDNLDSNTLLNASIASIKKSFLNFLLCRKPKTVKSVLDILSKVYLFYGRGVDNEQN